MLPLGNYYYYLFIDISDDTYGIHCQEVYKYTEYVWDGSLVCHYGNY